MGVMIENVVREITAKLLKKLPEGEEFYTPGTFKDCGLPDFLTAKLILEIKKNLAEAASLPASDWVDPDNEKFLTAWRSFLSSLDEGLRVPVSHMRSVMETAVAETLELLIVPRETIPAVLFTAEDELSCNELKERAELIVVYPLIVRALLRYMEKKEKETLLLNDCRKLVAAIDQKLTGNFSPDEWADILTPLFELAGPEVDPNLLRLFFDEKGESETADKFDRIVNPLDRTSFIEVLSSDEIPAGLIQPNPLAAHPGAKEEVPASDFKEEPGHKPVETGTGPDAKDEDSLVPENTILGSFLKKRSEIKTEKNTFKRGEEEDIRTETEGQPEAKPEQPGQTIIPLPPEPPAEKESEPEPVQEQPFSSTTDDAEKKEIPLHKRFILDEDAIPEDEEAEEEEITSIYKEMKLTREEIRSFFGDEDIDKEKGATDDIQYTLNRDNRIEEAPVGGKTEPANEESNAGNEEHDAEIGINLEQSGGESGDEPIWKAFLEQVTDEEGEPYLSEPEEQETTELFAGRGGVEPAAAEPAGTQEEHKLRSWLIDDKQRFVVTIFGGSEEDYKKALGTIVRFNEWKQVSAYVEEEIFSKYSVDLFDEAAVDFTDRLHTFFTEVKS